MKVFIDDLNIHNMTWENHLEYIWFLLKLREVNLNFNPNKCGFTKTSIGFLGHIVSRERTQCDQWKFKTIAKFLMLAFIIYVWAFLGLTYYMNYVKGYSHITMMLLKLMKNDSMFLWTPHCQNAFDVLKNALFRAPILIQVDLTKPFILNVDWWTWRVGTILSQWEARNERVVAYVNKGFSLIQKRFHPMEGECYVLIWDIMHFWQYFYHNHYIICIDHKPLEWMATMLDAYGRRWWINML